MKLGENSTASSSVLKLVRIIHKIGENRIIAITHAKIPTLTLLRLAAFAIGGDSIHWVNQILGNLIRNMKKLTGFSPMSLQEVKGFFIFPTLAGNA